MNNRINRLNSSMEIILTLCIFASSFLVLTIEKYWWSAPLGSGSYPTLIQKLLSLTRLIIVASSIAFFMIITMLDVA